MSNESALKTIRNLIISTDFSSEELNAISSVMKSKRDFLTARAKQSLWIGASVFWISTRGINRGRKITGKVTKINTKYVLVSTDQGPWKVPASMLEVL